MNEQDYLSSLRDLTGQVAVVTGYVFPHIAKVLDRRWD